MPRLLVAAALLLLASTQAFAAPRYMSRVRSSAIRQDPAPTPTPAPQTESAPAEVRLSRIVAIAHRTEPAAPPTLHPHAQFIDTEALEQFFPGKPESGGGFMPMTMRQNGIRPRTDGDEQAQAQAQHAAVFLAGVPSAGAAAPHNRDQGGRPSVRHSAFRSLR